MTPPGLWRGLDPLTIAGFSDGTVRVCVMGRSSENLECTAILLPPGTLPRVVYDVAVSEIVHLPSTVQDGWVVRRRAVFIAVASSHGLTLWCLLQTPAGYDCKIDTSEWTCEGCKDLFDTAMVRRLNHDPSTDVRSVAFLPSTVVAGSTNPVDESDKSKWQASFALAVGLADGQLRVTRGCVTGSPRAGSLAPEPDNDDDVAGGGITELLSAVERTSLPLGTTELEGDEDAVSFGPCSALARRLRGHPMIRNTEWVPSSELHWFVPDSRAVNALRVFPDESDPQSCTLAVVRGGGQPCMAWVWSTRSDLLDPEEEEGRASAWSGLVLPHWVNQLAPSAKRPEDPSMFRSTKSLVGWTCESAKGTMPSPGDALVGCWCVMDTHVASGITGITWVLLPEERCAIPVLEGGHRGDGNIVSVDMTDQSLKMDSLEALDTVKDRLALAMTGIRDEGVLFQKGGKYVPHAVFSFTSGVLNGWSASAWKEQCLNEGATPALWRLRRRILGDSWIDSARPDPVDEVWHPRLTIEETSSDKDLLNLFGVDPSRSSKSRTAQAVLHNLEDARTFMLTEAMVDAFHTRRAEGLTVPAPFQAWMERRTLRVRSLAFGLQADTGGAGYLGVTSLGWPPVVALCATVDPQLFRTNVSFDVLSTRLAWVAPVDTVGMRRIDGWRHLGMLSMLPAAAGAWPVVSAEASSVPGLPPPGLDTSEEACSQTGLIQSAVAVLQAQVQRSRSSPLHGLSVDVLAWFLERACVARMTAAALFLAAHPHDVRMEVNPVSPLTEFALLALADSTEPWVWRGVTAGMCRARVCPADPGAFPTRNTVQAAISPFVSVEELFLCVDDTTRTTLRCWIQERVWTAVLTGFVSRTMHALECLERLPTARALSSRERAAALNQHRWIGSAIEAANQASWPLLLRSFPPPEAEAEPASGWAEVSWLVSSLDAGASRAVLNELSPDGFSPELKRVAKRCRGAVQSLRGRFGKIRLDDSFESDKWMVDAMTDAPLPAVLASSWAPRHSMNLAHGSEQLCATSMMPLSSGSYIGTARCLGCGASHLIEVVSGVTRSAGWEWCVPGGSEAGAAWCGLCGCLVTHQGK
jgi:hypothetical protein